VTVAAGRVAWLARWPVKSVGGEPLRRARLDGHGLAGDRLFALIDDRRSHLARPYLTAREAPRMLRWRAAYPGAPDDDLVDGQEPGATVIGPDGRVWTTDDDGLAGALADDLGFAVTIRREPGQQDLRDSILLTVEASLAALGDELGGRLDHRRFRPNLHLELDGAPFAEEGWEGGRLLLEGGVVLRLLHPCERCAIPTLDPETADRRPELLRHITVRHDGLFGLNARVEIGGLVTLGEAVRVEAA
jgi:uncharacterized protein